MYHQLFIFTQQRLAGLDGTQNIRTSPGPAVSGHCKRLCYNYT